MLNALGKAASASYPDNPIFVVGAGRSDASSLLQAVGKHPKIISSPGETPFLTSIGGPVGEFELADSKHDCSQSPTCSPRTPSDQRKPADRNMRAEQTGRGSRFRA